MPYRAGQRSREVVEAEINRKPDAGAVEPTLKKWASAAVPVSENDGKLCCCVEYRRLDVVTVRDSYPVPGMNECISSLGEAALCTALDCNRGYWQIEVAEANRNKTTFTFHSGILCFNWMPFGLKNARATLQRAVNIILSRVMWKTALVYPEDVNICSRTVTEYLAHVKEILPLLQTAGVLLNLAKCTLVDSAASYLGHNIRPGQLDVDERNLVAINRVTAPKNKTELRFFFDMCRLYRRFVPGFAKIAALLNKKIGKGELFEFELLTHTKLDAFPNLQKNLVSPPMLAVPRPRYRYTLDTTACE